MKICQGGLQAVRKVVHEITPEIEIITDEVLYVTGKIKKLEANPTVDAVAKLIPEGSRIENWLNKAIDVIEGVDNSVKTLAEKLLAVVDGKTEFAKNRDLFKISSVAVGIGDVESGSPYKSESLYDSAVQLHVMTNQGKAVTSETGGIKPAPEA